jgi:glycosyltransferase involved in cell wall biosynthesis
VEVIVVDDGSSDATALRAREAGARVLTARVREQSPDRGNPAAARNQGAAAASGDPIVFLDADCLPADGWLAALLAAHDAGAAVVGGSLALPPGLPVSARCDYYCGWYHVHERRPAGVVVNHPPGNLSVRRAAFAEAVAATGGFTEAQPIAYAHEELAWQGALRARGHAIRFEPRAVVHHYNRPGFGNLLRRNYRWAYSAIESKAETGAARMAWVYRWPRLLVAASFALVVPQAAYIIWCWMRAGVLEPVAMFPAVVAARMAYAAGMAAGGVRWLRAKSRPGAMPEVRPRWE